MPAIIREICQDDNARLAEIIRSCFLDFEVKNKCGTVYSDPDTDRLYEVFRKKDSVLLTAEDDGELLGCCGIYPTDNLPDGCCELVKFYLSAEARGKGIGRKLLESALQNASDFGYHSVYIESLPEFSRAVSIYKKLGFRFLDSPMGNSGHSGCSIWMMKEF